MIWIGEGQPLRRESVVAIDDAIAASNPPLVSPISAWERGLLVSLGRIASPVQPKNWFDQFLEQGNVDVAPLDADILIDSSFLPGDIHRDPADRIIIATARALELTIVTRDKLILDYAAKGHVRALAC